MLGKKRKNGTIPKYFWGAGEQHCIIFMALASASKIISGNRGTYFGKPGIIFREQGSTYLPWEPL